MPKHSESKTGLDLVIELRDQSFESYPGQVNPATVEAVVQRFLGPPGMEAAAVVTERAKSRLPLVSPSRAAGWAGVSVLVEWCGKSNQEPDPVI